MPPTKDRMGISGVERDVFEGFFCPCGNDAFLSLTRRAVDSGEPMPGAFGTNQRIQCAKCHRMYTFRDGRWVDTSPVTLPARPPKPGLTKTKKR